MTRIFTLMIAYCLLLAGCSGNPPKSMLSAIGVPDDPTTIHPWIAEMLESDVAGVTSAIQKRMSSDSSKHTVPLSELVADFVPRRIVYSEGIGYVFCVKRLSLGRSTIDVTDQLYIAQPLSEDAIRDRVAFFEEPIRLLMTEFYRKFAGCGEEKEGIAGQFVMSHFAKASDIAYYETEKLGKWKNGRLLYIARNGDSVFIDSSGATAWHVLETNELVPLFRSFPAFIEHYAKFRRSAKVFDSWESRESLGIRSQN